MKPQRVEPAVTVENRINESNMYCVYEPGHQGKRERGEAAVVCVSTRSVEMSHSYQQQFIKKGTTEEKNLGVSPASRNLHQEKHFRI